MCTSLSSSKDEISSYILYTLNMFLLQCSPCVTSDDGDDDDGVAYLALWVVLTTKYWWPN